MTAERLIKHIEGWAPPGAAWDKDNVGLQVGDGGIEVTNVLLSLDLNEKVLTEAIKKKCNFIFTHHPLIFKPLKKLDFQKDPKSKQIKTAIENKLTIFSAHTNLDFTKNGVSFELAKTLGLKDIDFLLNQEANQYKLVVFVPAKDTEKVANAIFEAGGGEIGEYEKCSYRIEGQGTFEGSEFSDPVIGQTGKLEKVDEVRLEVLVDVWNIRKVINKVLSVHPYEEPAYDVYPLRNRNVNYGMGAIGQFEKSYGKNEFLELVTKKLKAKNVRYTKGNSSRIKKVAVCGGSGSDMLSIAIAAKADAFITADVKYHTFQDAENNIMLIDAGHYETEIHALNFVKNKLEKFLSDNKSNIKVFKYTGSTNPVSFYKT